MTIDELQAKADEVGVPKDPYYQMAFGLIPGGFDAREYAIGKVVEAIEAALGA